MLPDPGFRAVRDADLTGLTLGQRDRRLDHLLAERVAEIDGFAEFIARRIAWLDVLCHQQLSQRGA